MSPNAASALARELGDSVDLLRRVTVQVRTRRASIGAGVVWDGGGLVITNAHVVQGARAVVEFADGTVASASVVARDRRRDLAALGLEPPADVVRAALRDPPTLRAGELVIAVGHPGGQVGAAALGIIHVGDTGQASEQWIRADLRLAPGFSGGPLGDAAGRLVGINTMIHGGLALAVPARSVERWVRGLGRPADRRAAGAGVP